MIVLILHSIFTRIIILHVLYIFFMFSMFLINHITTLFYETNVTLMPLICILNLCLKLYHIYD